MRTITRLLALVCFALTAPIVATSCSTAPSGRVAAVQTLKATGETAEAAVVLSAQLYRDGKITATQARQVMDLYDGRFQPAFRVAVAAVHGDLSSIASPELLSLAGQISALVLQFQTHSP